MTYASNWPLAEPALFPGLIRSYVRDTVLKDQGLSLVTWDRCSTQYALVAQQVSKAWGSMVADEGFYLDIPQRLTTLDERTQWIRNRIRPDSTQSNIRRVFRKARQAARDKKKRIFVVYLNSFWFDGSEARGHAQFIVIDYRRKKQVFFDPHGYNCRAFFKVLCDIPPFVEGHTNVPADQALGYRLQGHMESDLEAEQTGTCGITTFLTLLCARRFNYWHMPRLTVAIRDAFPSSIDAATIINGLVDLYESRVLRLNIRSLTTLTEEQEKEFFLTMFPPEDRCRVYSEISGKFCSRKACNKGDVLSLCWQHRFYLQNPYNISRKCMASFR